MEGTRLLHGGTLKEKEKLIKTGKWTWSSKKPRKENPDPEREKISRTRTKNEENSTTQGKEGKTTTLRENHDHGYGDGKLRAKVASQGRSRSKKEFLVVKGGQSIFTKKPDNNLKGQKGIYEGERSSRRGEAEEPAGRLTEITPFRKKGDRIVGERGKKPRRKQALSLSRQERKWRRGKPTYVLVALSGKERTPGPGEEKAPRRSKNKKEMSISTEKRGK